MNSQPEVQRGPSAGLEAFEAAVAAAERGLAAAFPCEAVVPPADMDACGTLLARLVKPGEWLFLNGDLGAGKTTLTRSLVRAWGGPAEVTSPTFALMNVIPLAAGQRLLHLDLYRVKSWEELLFLGIENELDPRNTRVVVEWAELVSAGEWAELGAHLGFTVRARTVELAHADDPGTRRISIA